MPQRQLLAMLIFTLALAGCYRPASDESVQPIDNPTLAATPTQPAAQPLLTQDPV